MLSRAQRLRGGLLGLLVGDALGVPYEFHPPEEIPPPDQIEMQPPPGFRRAHAGVPVGTWSDDGAHALCLLASLLHCGRLDPEDLMRRLTNWGEHGYMAVDGKVFVTNDDGETFVMAAGKEFKLLHVNRLNEPVLASPALVDGTWYFRTHGHLIAIQ